MWIPVFRSLLPVLDLPHGEKQSFVKLEFSMCQLESCPPSEVWLHFPFTLQAAARSLLCLLCSRLTSILSLSLPTMCSSSLEPSLESFLVLGSPDWNSSSLPVHLGAFFRGRLVLLGVCLSKVSFRALWEAHCVPFPGRAASPQLLYSLQARKERFCELPQ